MGYGLYGLGHDPKDVPPPKFGKAPMELLTDKTVDPPSLGSTYGFQTAMGMLGAGAHGTTNWVYKRPAIAGIHRYPIYFALGAVLGQAIVNWRQGYFAERDAIMRHYIQLHPEDFPPPERKKYGDVLLMWIPIR